MNVEITPEINADVIMPEGFEVQLTLTSLVPETKNLMYDSIDNPVTSAVATNNIPDSENEKFYPESIRKEPIGWGWSPDK